MSVTSFEAKYRSECGDCDTVIVPGDTVRWSGSYVVHVTCPTPVLEVTRPPCPVCFTVPATNGECGCVG